MALSNVNLHIKSGETIGIIGGTGSSKSSLIQLISRLYDVTEGVVRVGGRDVREYDLKTDSVIKYQLYFRRISCSQARSKIIFVGEIKMLQMKNWWKLANLRRQMSLSASSRMDMIPILNREEQTYPEVRSNVFVLQERFLKNRRSSFWMIPQVR